MRVLFTPHPMTSHLFQTAGFAWACQVAGHDVRVAAQPHILDLVASAGLTGVAVGGAYDILATSAQSVAQNTARTRAARGGRAGGQEPGGAALREILESRMEPFVGAAEDVAEDMVTFAKWWRPDVVIGDTLVYAAPLAAAAVGAPYLRFLGDVDWGYRTALPGTGIGWEENPRAAWPDRLTALYHRYGVSPRPCLAVRTIDVCPDSLQFPDVPNRLPVRFVPYNGSARIPAWLLEPPERPRVCVTFGTATTSVIGPSGFKVPAAIEGLAEQDVEVVAAVTPADRELLGDLPGNVRVAEQLPMRLLLPTCDAIVHQGGSGNMLTAALFGVPQVVLAGFSFTRVCGELVAQAGAGVTMSWDDADPATIAAAVTTVLADGPQEAAGRIRDEMLAQPPAAEVIAAVQDLTHAGAAA